MEKFTYSFPARIIYRFGNLIATPLLSVHLLFSFYMMFEIWYYVFPGLINLLVIYVINRYYIKTYRTFPFTIETDNEKIICKDFFTGNKTVVIKYEDISELRGGLFSGYPTRPVYFTDGKQNITIGFYSHVGNFQKLLTVILKNIPQPLYNKTLDGLKGLGVKNKKPIR